MLQLIYEGYLEIDFNYRWSEKAFLQILPALPLFHDDVDFKD